MKRSTILRWLCPALAFAGAVTGPAHAQSAPLTQQGSLADVPNAGPVPPSPL